MCGAVFGMLADGVTSVVNHLLRLEIRNLNFIFKFHDVTINFLFFQNSYCIGLKEPESIPEMTSTSAAAAVVQLTSTAQQDSDDSEIPPSSDKADSGSSSDSDSSSSEEEEKVETKKSKKKSKKREKKRAKKLKRKEKKAAKKQEKLDKEFKKPKDPQEISDDRKRPYNSMYDIKAPTEDEIEEWKRKRTRDEDPMLQFMSK